MIDCDDVPTKLRFKMCKMYSAQQNVASMPKILGTTVQLYNTVRDREIQREREKTKTKKQREKERETWRE